MTDLRIGIFGAGAIGTYLGVRLSAGGAPVTLVGRPWLVEGRERLAAAGLDGRVLRPTDSLRCTTDPAALRDCDLCLVTVKATNTDDAGRTLAPLLSRQATVVSLQNGLGNVARLTAAGLANVVAGMVTFNIVRDEDAPGELLFRRATSGPIITGVIPDLRVRDAFAAAGEPLVARPDIEAIQHSKLLLNLNNGLCAVAGVSIFESIYTPDLRWCFAACMEEGLGVLRGAGLPLRRIGALSIPAVLRMLRLPDVVVRRLAGRFMRIDRRARSSTLQDLDRRRVTEIDYLNGAIAAIAAQHGGKAPRNATVAALVHELERGERAFVPPGELRAAIERAAAGHEETR